MAFQSWTGVRSFPENIAKHLAAHWLIARMMSLQLNQRSVRKPADDGSVKFDFPNIKDVSTCFLACTLVEKKAINMKSTTLTSLFVFTLLSAAAAQSQVSVSEGGTLPFKARIVANSSLTPSTGRVDYTFSVFTEAAGGVKVFEERHSLQSFDGNIYAEIGSKTPGGIPAGILKNNARLWVEMAKSSSPWAAEQPRLRIDHGTPSGVAPAITITFTRGARLCFTCGGGWNIITGIFSSNPGAASEFGVGCGGTRGTTFNDHQPWLCSPE